MKTFDRRARPSLAAFSIAATVFVLALGLGVHAEVIEQIIVKVNGEIFTKSDLEARQVAALRGMNREGDPTDAQLRQMLDEVTPELLVNVVDEMLILQRGKELGYRLSDDRFQAILKQIREENKIESEEQFQAALKQENMTLLDLRKQLERQMIVSQVQQNEVLGKVAVSDEEARRYYDGHKDEFTSPQTITLREIFVSVPGDGKTINVGLDEEAREKTAGIRERVQAGERFETLAAELSDSPSKANAGLIGPLSLTDLNADLRKLVESMKVGQVSEILRAPRGYQLLKLESMTSPETRSFEDAKTDISNKVFTDKRRAEFQKFIDRLRAEAIIEWKNQDVKKAYDQGVEQSKNTSAK